MRKLSWAQVLGGRLARGRLLEPASDARAAASAAEGIHAQILSAAELSLAARVEGARLADVRADLWERRRLVKTWLQRGTVHVVPADELPLWAAALGGPAEPALAQAVTAVLSDTPRTREELAGLVGDDRLRSAWGTGLKEAARAGRLVFGPSRGATTTFVLPPRAPAPREDALQWALRRFLGAYGRPATATSRPGSACRRRRRRRPSRPPTWSRSRSRAGARSRSTAPRGSRLRRERACCRSTTAT